MSRVRTVVPFSDIRPLASDFNQFITSKYSILHFKKHRQQGTEAPRMLFILKQISPVPVFPQELCFFGPFVDQNGVELGIVFHFNDTVVMEI
jgi:hypothetical protein